MINYILNNKDSSESAVFALKSEKEVLVTYYYAPYSEVAADTVNWTASMSYKEARAYWKKLIGVKVGWARI